jgi:predicted transglutaminase-like cysteine proteinase
VIDFNGYNSTVAPASDALLQKWWTLRSMPTFISEAMDVSLVSLAATNKRINQAILYKAELFKSDVWQSPARTIEIGSGDCEDFAILKYASLLKAGMNEAELAICVGQIKSIAGNRDHAWLGVNQGGVWRVLDCKFDQLISNNDYANWLPIVAIQGPKAILYGREFTIAEKLEQSKA